MQETNRPVILTSIVCKLFERIIIKRPHSEPYMNENKKGGWTTVGKGDRPC